MNEFFFKEYEEKRWQVVNNLREFKMKVADLEKTNEDLNYLLVVNIVKYIQKLTHINEWISFQRI
jgi:hypothetical protein